MLKKRTRAPRAALSRTAATRSYPIRLLTLAILASFACQPAEAGNPKTGHDGRPSRGFFSETDYAHAETLGFSSLSTTDKAFKFYRSNDITMRQTLAQGTGILQETTCYTISASSPVNDSYVAGIRTFFKVDFTTTRGTGSTVTYEIIFGAGLPTNGRMLFMDFDVDERIRIKAFNSSNALIPFSAMTFTRHNGQEATGSGITTTVFEDFDATNYTGQVRDNNGATANDAVVSLQCSQVVKKLVYEVEMNPNGDATQSNNMGFNFVTPVTAGRIYVNHAATGSNNGSSWTDAYTSLETGMDNAYPGDELWVAKGTYRPSSTQELSNTTDRYRHFRLPNAVSVMGGFTSGQTDSTQRTDYGLGGANETVLSGDLNGNDSYSTTPWSNTSENTYHVIYHPSGTCMSESSMLNGISVKGGYADGGAGDIQDGGGLYLTSRTPIRFIHMNLANNYSIDDGSAMYLINGSNSSNSRVSFYDVQFRSNIAGSDGTVYCTDDSEADFYKTEIRNNTVTTDGGGIVATSAADLRLYNVIVADNTAGDDGGGIVARSITSTAGYTTTLSGYNVVLTGNTASGDDGGGLLVDGYSANPTNVTLNNATIVANRCKDDGGGIMIETSGTLTTNAGIITLNNCIVYENSVGLPTASGDQSGKQIFANPNTTVVLNHVNIPSTTTGSGSTSEIAGTGTLTLGPGNVTASPQFRNNVTGDYRLTSGSPAADAGNDSYASLSTDIRGSVGRKLLKTNASATGTIDMGAYEFHATTDANKYWTGTVSNLWNVAGNWSDNAVPHANDIVEVNSGTPQLNVDYSTDRTLTIGGTGTMTVLSTSTLGVGATGTLAMGGRPVTLKSDASGTARFGQMLGTLTGATNVTVERHLPAGRKWRFLCAPLKGSSNNSIFHNWQNNDVPNGSTGVEVWGPGGSADPSSSNTGLAVGPNPSMRSYDAGWQAVTNTNDSKLFDANTNIAYALFLTGPYNNGSTQYIGNQSNLPNGVASTLTATGTLITGDHNKTLNAATAGQYFLVANPYASPVNPASFTAAGTVNRTNLDNILYMWDAKQGGTNGLGRYVSFDIQGNAYSIEGGTGTGYPAGTQIQSGQSFFVRATAPGSATLVFRESSKTTTSSNDMMGNSTETIPKSVRIQLEQDGMAVDGAMAFFHQGATASVDGMDGVKLMNGNDNLGLRREGRTLVFEHRPDFTSSDTLHIVLSQMQRRAHTMRISCKGMEAKDGYRLELWDRHTQRRHEVSMNDTTKLEFTVDADESSTGERFLIVLSKTSFSAGTTAEPSATAVGPRPYPNPLSGSAPLRLELDPERAPWALRLVDITGRTLWMRNGVYGTEKTVEIDMSARPAGLYHLETTDGRGNRAVSKVVKQ